MKGATATQSGVYTLPFVLSLVVGSTLSGVFTQKVGYYVPAMIASPSLLAVGQGLMSTFRVNESSSHWIGFQVVAGFGLGLGMQAASLAAQAVLPMPDVPIGIAIMFFAQQLGGGIFTSVGQNLLSTYLVSHLDIPGLSADEITSEGATDLVTSVAPQYQLTVKTVYNEAIQQIFRCAMGVALVATAAALFMEWKNVKKTGPAPAPGAGPRAQPVDDLPSEESSALFIDSSPKFSSDNNFNTDRKDGNVRINDAMPGNEGIRTSSVSKTGCEHCEHCRLSRALTLSSPERGSISQPPRPPSHRNSRSQPLAYQVNAPGPRTLEEAARLASIAREAVAQLEELTRPFSTIGASIDHHPVQGVPRPERAYVPQHVSRQRSLTAPEIPPRKARKEPTTQELVENAQRVSAQLEREGREQRTRELEKRRETEETESRRSDQSSRQFSATIFMSSSSPPPPQSPTFSPRDRRFPSSS